MFLGSHPGTIDNRGPQPLAIYMLYDCHVDMCLILQSLLEFSQLMKYEEVLSRMIHLLL